MQRLPALRYARVMPDRYPSRGDQKLIQIVDSALADVTLRSGEWLTCQPGCTQCCIGVLAINQLDALRLQRGLAELKSHDPDRAAAIRRRARESVARLSSEFPGNAEIGLLREDEESIHRFENFGNDEPCPALDPQTGLCDLYDWRPITCRVFGPPVRSEEGLGVCELCFQGATDEEIAACEMVPDPDDLESRLVKETEERTGQYGNTLVAFCLSR